MTNIKCNLKVRYSMSTTTRPLVCHGTIGVDPMGQAKKMAAVQQTSKRLSVKIAGCPVVMLPTPEIWALEGRAAEVFVVCCWKL